MSSTWSSLGTHITGAGTTTATAGAGVGTWESALASSGLSTGKKYFEMTMTTGATITNVGIANASQSLSAYVGSDANGIADFSNGQSFTSGGSTGTSVSWSASPNTGIIAVAVDLDNKRIWYKTVGGSGSSLTGWNEASPAGSNDPGTATGGLSYTSTGSMFPAISFANSGDTAVLNTVGSFTGTLPSGFSAWDGAAPADTLQAQICL